MLCPFHGNISPTFVASATDLIYQFSRSAQLMKPRILANYCPSLVLYHLIPPSKISPHARRVPWRSQTSCRCIKSHLLKKPSALCTNRCFSILTEQLSPVSSQNKFPLVLRQWDELVCCLCLLDFNDFTCEDDISKRKNSLTISYKVELLQVFDYDPLS